MILSYEYSRAYLPSAPVIEIGFRRTPKEREIVLEALLDTGADATILPYSLLKSINAIYGEVVSMRGITGISQRMQTFVIAIRVGQHLIPAISAVADRHGTETILGRDVLNQLILTLNGPALTTQIHE